MYSSPLPTLSDPVAVQFAADVPGRATANKIRLEISIVIFRLIIVSIPCARAQTAAFVLPFLPGVRRDRKERCCRVAIVQPGPSAQTFVGNTRRAAEDEQTPNRLGRS